MSAVTEETPIVVEEKIQKPQKQKVSTSRPYTLFFFCTHNIEPYNYFTQKF